MRGNPFAGDPTISGSLDAFILGALIVAVLFVIFWKFDVLQTRSERRADEREEEARLQRPQWNDDGTPAE